MCDRGCRSPCPLRRKYYLFLLGLSAFALLFLYYTLHGAIFSGQLPRFFDHHVDPAFLLASTLVVENRTATNSPFWLPPPVQKNVLVFVHIQKTGGTLIERRLVKSGLRNRSCLCVPGVRRCQCRTTSGDTWLVSRFSTGWICGLHADLTEYTECVDHKLNKLDGKTIQRSFTYFTLLRNPVDRFLSEWLHVRRGATWHEAKLQCAGSRPSSQIYRPCYTIPEFRVNSTTVWFHGHLTWTDVDLDTFVRCKYNLAINRQTRMLANLRPLGCYEHLLEWSEPRGDSPPQLALLHSAKYNLVTFLRTFGLSDYLVYTQYLYQRSLRITFNRLFIPTASSNHFSHAYYVRRNMSDLELQMIREVNWLDEKLYAFATRLFVLRLTWYVIRDSCVSLCHKRPLLTLLRARNFRGLDDILLDKTHRNYFRRQFTNQLIRLLKRQGSSPPSMQQLSHEQVKWDKVLMRDFDFGDNSSSESY